MKERDKLILSGFIAGCLLLTGLYSTVVFWLSEIAKKTNNIEDLENILNVVSTLHVDFLKSLFSIKTLTKKFLRQ